MPAPHSHGPVRTAWDEDVIDAITQAAPLPRSFRRSAPRPRRPARPATDVRHDPRPVESATFALRLDWFAHPDALVDLDVSDAGWSFDDRSTDRFEPRSCTVLRPSAGYAARHGDAMHHGGTVSPGLGSRDVHIGGRPALRSCDTHVCTSTTPTPHATAGFAATYPAVRINGFPALRVGDHVDEGTHGLNPITSGCPTVTIGPVPEPVVCWQRASGEPTLPPDRIPFRWHRGEERATGKLVLGARIRGAIADGTTTAAMLWAEHRIAPSRARDVVATRGKSERALGTVAMQLAPTPPIPAIPRTARLRPPAPPYPSHVVDRS